MSVVLKLPENGSSKKVYLIYDFKQVSDSILLIMYVDELNRWKKFFINFEDGEWKTNILIPYTDSQTLQQICDKLKFIFSEKEHITLPDGVSLEETMQQEAAFMLGIGS